MAGRTVAFAAADSHAFETSQSGIFTKYLLAWWQGQSGTNQSGVVKYVSENVRRETGGWQRPVVGRL